VGTRSTRRRVFHDPRLERRFRRDGYVIVPFADPERIRELADVYTSLPSGISEGYYASMHSRDAAYKRAAHQAITERFWPVLGRLLVDHEPVVGAFMVKHPGPDTSVPPHQDWIVTDESEGLALNCWFPVTPVTDEVGRMSVLPRSHRYLSGLRGSPGFPTQIESISAEVAQHLLEPMKVEVGEAIIYENRLLHGTPPNLSHDTRIVAYISAVPSGADRRHYFLNDEGAVECYRVSKDFFVEFNIGDRPDGELFDVVPDYSIEKLSLDDLRRIHRRAHRPLASLGQHEGR
jgi:hypothetical protein